MRALWIIAITIVLLFWFRPEPKGGEDRSPLSSLTLGMVPKGLESEFRVQQSLLLDHLSKELGIPVKLTLVPNETELMVLLARSYVDLALWSGLQHLVACEEYGAKALVMAHEEPSIRWVLLSNGAAGDRKSGKEAQGVLYLPAELRDQEREAMLMALHQHSPLESRGAPSEVKSHGDELASRDHLETAFDSQVLMKDRGDLVLRDHEIVAWASPRFPKQVWTGRSSLHPEDLRRLRESFCVLDPSSAQDAAVLKGLGTRALIPCVDEDFSWLKQGRAGRE